MYTFQTINSDFGIHYKSENISVVFGHQKLNPNNLKELFKNIEFKFLNQKHSTTICSNDNVLDVCDGLQWNQPNYSGVIRTADCLPLIVIDHTELQFFNLHCGRKGLVDGILDNLLKLTNTDHTFSFFIGPHIETYEIGLDLYNELKSKNINSLTVVHDKYFFSLADFTKKFISAHFTNYKLYEANVNTLLDPMYWSYRADKSTPERNLSFAYTEEK
jgi:hypothetical protein